jgi:alpha-ketoglutarate-dependent taurine dioxygenase
MSTLTPAPLAPTFGALLEAGQVPLEGLEVASLLAAHGALLFRGYGFTLESFKAFSAQHSGDFSDYEGGVFRAGALNRDTIGGDPTVLTTTGHSQGFPISLHGEMHYLKNPPAILWFFCQRPSAQDGQTTLCDGRAMWQALGAEAQEFFRSHQVCYTRYLEDGSWQTTFGSDSLEQVGTVCRREGMEWSFDEQNRSVTTHYRCSALRGGEVFINNVLPVLDTEWAYNSGWMKENLAAMGAAGRPPLIVRAGDGSELPQAVVKALRQAAREHTIELDWQAGDVAMIDNLRVMHGRRQASDPERSILVRLASAAAHLSV